MYFADFIDIIIDFSNFVCVLRRVKNGLQMGYKWVTDLGCNSQAFAVFLWVFIDIH